jgi:hypothetical protein
MKGISTWRNDNSFFVCQVHYTADPDKNPDTDRGKRWLNEAKKGLSEASWRKEYEIDWFALTGNLIYPDFDRSVHCIEPFKIPAEWTRYMAIDPGLRNPTAVLWAAVDPDENVFVYDEHYVAEKTVDWHSEIIKQKESYKGNDGKIINDRIFIRLIDPAASSRSPLNKVSILDEYRRYGIVCKTANNDVITGINRVNQFLSTDSLTGHPRLLFFRTLKNTIGEIEHYRYEDSFSDKSESRDPTEKPIKKKDHLLDCLRYIVMENPHHVRKIKPEKTRIHKWDSMTTGYW